MKAASTPVKNNTTQERDQMNIVIVGHVDHGKSTLVGRLLADTGALPAGKLESVKANCERNAKPFEYAFLLDALKDEQAQGITIDTARCFFKSSKRDYIIIDAPGHIEFLKNMISGAARAEAAVLVIDAKEGIRENSKRHGYMLSFLGIKNITVVVNKMDLVNHDEWTFNTIKEEYLKFLAEINMYPMNFIPIAAREGDNMMSKSPNTPWYKGPSVLEALDGFVKAPELHEKELRFPLQDIYKFTQAEDDRRIFSGRIESGTLRVGDDVVFLPSNKRSKVATIEGFNLPVQKEAFAGQSTGVCLETQIYVRPGEILCKATEHLPHVTKKFKANLFWMSKQPLVKNKTYKLKITTQHVPVMLSEIVSVLDATELSSIKGKSQVDRHDVAECIFEAFKPIAFDEVSAVAATGRFVIVDNYEISGGGIILAPVFDEDSSIKEHVRTREFQWERSSITTDRRGQRYQHKPALIVISGLAEEQRKNIAKALEEKLFSERRFTYLLGVGTGKLQQTVYSNDKTLSKLEQIQQLGEMVHVMTDAGLIVIANVSDIDDDELEMVKSLNRPHQTIVVNVGDKQFDPSRIDILVDDKLSVEAALKAMAPQLNKAIELDPEFTI